MTTKEIQQITFDAIKKITLQLNQRQQYSKVLAEVKVDKI
jgi:hypothetical protein